MQMAGMKTEAMRLNSVGVPAGVSRCPDHGHWCAKSGHGGDVPPRAGIDCRALKSKFRVNSGETI